MEENSLPPRQKWWVLVFSTGVFYLTVDLVRRRKVREDDSWVWLFIGITVFILGVNYRLLKQVSNFLGIVLPTSTLFFFGQMFMMIFGMTASIRFTRIFFQIKNLVQKVALLELKLAELEKALASDREKREVARIP